MEHAQKQEVGFIAWTNHIQL